MKLLPGLWQVRKLTNFASQWNTSFGTPPSAQPPAALGAQSSSLSLASTGASESSSIQDIQAAQAQLPSSQQLSSQHYQAAPVQNFVTPAMWQESVASVYEGGLKRSWDYDGHMSVKRR